MERTGALTYIARRLLTPLGNSELTLTIVIRVTIGSISAFINNTAVALKAGLLIFSLCAGAPGSILLRYRTVRPVTTKAQQNADNVDGAENAEVKSAILLGFLRMQ